MTRLMVFFLGDTAERTKSCATRLHDRGYTEKLRPQSKLCQCSKTSRALLKKQYETAALTCHCWNTHDKVPHLIVDFTANCISSDLLRAAPTPCCTWSELSTQQQKPGTPFLSPPASSGPTQRFEPKPHDIASPKLNRSFHINFSKTAYSHCGLSNFCQASPCRLAASSKVRLL